MWSRPAASRRQQLDTSIVCLDHPETKKNKTTENVFSNQLLNHEFFAHKTLTAEKLHVAFFSPPPKQTEEQLSNNAICKCLLHFCCQSRGVQFHACVDAQQVLESNMNKRGIRVSLAHTILSCAHYY